jgi:aspartyl-tRNA synthetase
VSGGATLSRKDVDALTSAARGVGASGLATLKRQGDQLSGPLARIDGISAESMQLEDGDLWLVAAGPDHVTSAALDVVRRAVIDRLAIQPGMAHAFLWVEDFPLFERDPDTGDLTFAHHPFTAPQPSDLERLLAGEREGIRAQHYDLVVNGVELGSGSIRITDPLVQTKVLELLGIDGDEAERRFGFLLRALRDGAPPHGGFAVGFDRVVMLLAGAASLREVIAYPKTTAARALFEDAPTPVTAADLADLGIVVSHD